MVLHVHRFWLVGISAWFIFPVRLVLDSAVVWLLRWLSLFGSPQKTTFSVDVGFLSLRIWVCSRNFLTFCDRDAILGAMFGYSPRSWFIRARVLRLGQIRWFQWPEVCVAHSFGLRAYATVFLSPVRAPWLLVSCVLFSAVGTQVWRWLQSCVVLIVPADSEL